jgi:serpin B
MRNLPAGLVVLLLVACSSSPTPRFSCNAFGNNLESARARAQSSNQVALALESQLASGGGNVFFSPYSLSVALGMLYEGARGTSASAIARTAGFDPDAGVTGLGFAQLACALAADAAQGGNQLSVDDAIFAQQGKSLLPGYLAALQNLYDAPATLVDFVGAPTAAAQTINDWVSHATQGTIPELVSPFDIDQLTRLILVNAVYFHGTWANGFDPSKTLPAAFTTEGGTTVQVPMMNALLAAGLVPDYSNAAPTVLELAYEGVGSPPKASLALDVILPPPGMPLSSFESGLTAGALNTLLGEVSTAAQVQVSMPKLALSLRYDLSVPLRKMGMAPLFDATQADLSGVDGLEDLFVKRVIQQATLDVDESGTVASAATAVYTGGLLGFEETPSVQVNRPFLILLRDIPTGTLLFYGRVADPSQM